MFKLCYLYLSHKEESGWTEEDGDKSQLANLAVKILKVSFGVDSV